MQETRQDTLLYEYRCILYLQTQYIESADTLYFNLQTNCFKHTFQFSEQRAIYWKSAPMLLHIPLATEASTKTNKLAIHSLYTP